MNNVAATTTEKSNAVRLTKTKLRIPMSLEACAQLMAKSMKSAVANSMITCGSVGRHILNMRYVGLWPRSEALGTRSQRP